ncbi:AMP-binding protein [Kitasatospora sp. NPDC059327]|uniref:AMP-binding protein n=1 Tax=Kitasatospora sp. NPDC059327 TaxID=3346803 RepID=UPI003675D2C1
MPQLPAEPNDVFAVALQDPTRPAVVGPDGLTTTFGELARRAHRVANAMRELGLTQGDTVSALLHNSTECLEILLAVQQIGLYLVPINTHLTAEEVAYIVEDSGSKALFASADLARALAPVLGRLPSARYAVDGSADGWSAYQELRDTASSAKPENRSLGMTMGYTSGTTGRPRGVRRPLPPIPPEAVAEHSQVLMAQVGLVPGRAVHLLFSPFYHAAPGNFALGALQLGHTIVIRRKFDAAQVLTDIERYGVTSMHTVPTHIHRIMRLPKRFRAERRLESLQTIVVAGAPFPIDTKRAALEWFGPVVWEYLGSTEGAISLVSPQEALDRPGTLGRPAAVKILGEDGAELPPGEVGLIYSTLGGATFEYHNDADKTAKAVRTDGYMTVGDLGHLDEDGYLYLADRRDDLIITGGVNVYPAEIEQRLHSHPAILDVAVIGTPDPDWGASVVAVVQLEQGEEPTEELRADLDRHCREGLAAHKCPRRYEFRDTLPRTATGKLLRRVLRDEVDEGRSAAVPPPAPEAFGG